MATRVAIKSMGNNRKKLVRKINWAAIPEDIAETIQTRKKAHQERCDKETIPNKT